MGSHTLRRYESTWQAFFTMLATKTVDYRGRPAQEVVQALTEVQTYKLALFLQEFSNHSTLAQARNLYSALLLFPCCAQLRFEPLLRVLKRSWNQAMPRYPLFYQVEDILADLCNSPTPSTEVAIRERLIILLRILCLYRGVDLAQAHRRINTAQQPWMIWMLRKGRPQATWYPILEIQPMAVNPQYWLTQYLAITQDVTHQELFTALPGRLGRTPLKSDSINSLTTAFLRARGLQDWTAHSTRGASATALLKRGVPPILCRHWEIGKMQTVSTSFTIGCNALSKPSLNALSLGQGYPWKKFEVCAHILSFCTAIPFRLRAVST